MVAGHGGLPKVEIGVAGVHGEMYLQGAQVTSWIPAGGRDVLFLSREARFAAGHAIRGGIPVCFPWFGAKPDNPDAPSHGFVRLTSWTLESITRVADGVAVQMATSDNAETVRLWPFSFRLTLRVTFGASLRLDLTVANPGPATFQVEEALHSYYAVGDIAQARVHGLSGARYLDKVGGTREGQQHGDVTFDAETDRIYLDTSGEIRIDDPAGGRSIAIASTSSASTVVWNPWIGRAKAFADFGDDEWTRMLCVETCNVLSAAPAVVPGATHTMSVVVSVHC